MRDVQVFEGDDPKDWPGNNTHRTAPPQFRFIPTPLDCCTLYTNSMRNMRRMVREGEMTPISRSREVYSQNFDRNVGVDLSAAFSARE